MLFDRIARSGRLRGTGDVPGGFTIPTNNNEYHAWLSADGAECAYLRPPEVP